jgi:hypothetical protein
MMNTFYANTQAFHKDLQSRKDSGDRCWSCSSAGGVLVGFNVKKDFTTLGLPTRGCEPAVTLCPRCGVAYMNSFNAILDRRQGREPQPSEWTVEKFLTFAAERMR